MTHEAFERVKRRYDEATDAFMSLAGARVCARRNRDDEWLAEISAALPAIRDEQRAASDALRSAVREASD